MPQALMTSIAAIRTYLFGCNFQAVFTLVSKKTGNRYTYRFRRPSGKQNFFFVDVLSGPDNDTDYGFIGSVYRDRGLVYRAPKSNWEFSRSEKSIIPADALSVLGIDFFITRLNSDRDLDPPKLEFWHSGNCSRCGRTLTTPGSLAIGMGPTCAEKAGKDVIR